MHMHNSTLVLYGCGRPKDFRLKIFIFRKSHDFILDRFRNFLFKGDNTKVYFFYSFKSSGKAKVLRNDKSYWRKRKEKNNNNGR